MKKIISAALSLLLASNCFAVSAFASDYSTTLISETESAHDYETAEDMAEVLKELGLFKGVSDTDFDLDRAPTRVEAVVMLIRLLGKEAEALEGEWSHPFTDVPKWADSYIGYAFENGLTNGISKTEFGVSDASAAMYLTFVLRALEYSDKDGDFTWDAPFELAKEVGLLRDNINIDEFFRADVAMVSYHALAADIKDSFLGLAEKLMEDDVIDPEDFDEVYKIWLDPTGYDFITDFTGYDSGYIFDENGFFKGIKASDYVDLGDYKAIAESAGSVEVTEEELFAYIALMIPEAVVYEKITDRDIKEGDIINAELTLKASMMGMELANEALGSYNMELTPINLDEYSEELEEYLDSDEITSMLGMSAEEIIALIEKFTSDVISGAMEAKVGESYTVALSIPVDAGIGVPMELSCEFGVTVNYICGTASLGEITEEILESQGFESAEELLEFYTEEVLMEKQWETSQKILEGITCKELPDEIVEYFINEDLSVEWEFAKMDDMTLEEYIIDYEGYANIDSYVADWEEYCYSDAENALIMQAFAEDGGLTVPDNYKELDEYYAELADTYGETYAKYCYLTEVVVLEYLEGLFN